MAGKSSGEEPKRRGKAGKDGRFYDFVTKSGPVVRVGFVAPGVVRVRVSPDGSFPPAAMNRYGFIREPRNPPATEVREAGQAAELTTDEMAVRIDRKSGRLTFLAAGRTLTKEAFNPEVSGSGGFRLGLRCGNDEEFFGLGDQTRAAVALRGRKADLHVTNVSCYIPIPFFMSTAGYGVLVNTTYRLGFDLAASKPDRAQIASNGGRLDYYLIRGRSLPEILDRYTDLTGKPALPPKWSFALWFICRDQADVKEVMDDCVNFRREKIPCDVIGLEPGWMSRHYDYSKDRTWHPERFPIPFYAQTGQHNFLPAMKRLGYKVELWECNDYDLSFEAERRWGQAAASPSDSQATARPVFHADDVEKDVHFMHPVRMDKLTDPAEPWFEHHKKFIDQGVDFFKQDGALQVCAHPDRLYGNGMTDDEMHNLYPLLYSQQMHEGFRQYTGRRPCCFTDAGWAGLQRYTGTWTGDTGGAHATLVAQLNTGLCGHAWSTCDMEVTTPEGIHYGFLLPWAHVNSWNYWRHPWLQGERLQRIFTDYARLRYRLLPYLYSLAWQSHRTGLPMMRAMVLEFPDDTAARNLLHQYMLGRELLVGAFSNEVYLPAGRWFDFWTGEMHQGGKRLTYDPPEDRGGALFVRAGAIVPILAEAPDYVGQRPENQIELDVYPAADAAFELYEDDGVGYGYEKGQFALTHFRLSSGRDEWRLEIGRREGEYEGMPPSREYRLTIHVERRPSAVRLDGREVEYLWDQAKRVVRVQTPASGQAVCQIAL